MYTNHPVFRRLRETARRLNACGLVTFADQILRMIAYMDGTDRSLQNVKMMSQQSPVEFAMAVAKAKSVSPEAAAAVMSAVAMASSDIADTGAVGSELLINTIGTVIGSTTDVNVNVGDLCFTAASSGSIRVNLFGGDFQDRKDAYNLNYKVNDGEQVSVTLGSPMTGGGASISVEEGDKVYFKGTISTNDYAQSDSSYLNFVLDGEFDVSGNVMSMYGHEVPNQYDLCYLFTGCGSLYNAKDLVLPSTMSEGCCAGMFDGCTNLQSAPILRAEILADSCYANMFVGCSNLHELTCYAHPTASACMNMLDSESTGTLKCKYPGEWDDTIGLPAGWNKVPV